MVDPDNAWMSRKASAALGMVFGALGLESTEEGEGIAVVGRNITVAASVEHRSESHGQHILAARFDVSIAGAPYPALSAGVIGIDDTPEHARNRAVAEWGTQYGAPIGFAIGTRLGGKGPPPSTSSLAPFYSKVDVAGLLLFHGPPGLRGAVTEPGAILSDAFLHKVARAVAATMGLVVSEHDYRTATVQLAVEGTHPANGECRVDGAISTELLERVSSLDWPAGSPTYMFKSFFVAPPRDDGHA